MHECIPVQNWRIHPDPAVYYPRTGDNVASRAEGHVPVVAGAAMRQGASGRVDPGGFPDRPVAAFCKHAATTCRPVSAQVRARPLAENSILRRRLRRPGPERPGEGQGSRTRAVQVDAPGRPYSVQPRSHRAEPCGTKPTYWRGHDVWRR